MRRSVTPNNFFLNFGKRIILSSLALLLYSSVFSQSASTTVYWSSGWCTICSGSTYSCNPPWSGSGNWNNGIRCFSDPIPAGNVITGVCVTVYKSDCGYNNMCTTINGQSVQCLTSPGYHCVCGTCDPQTFCKSGALAGYNYGGSNCLQLSISGGYYEQAVCVSSATITFTYAPACTQSTAPVSASASPSTTCGGATTLSVGGGSLGTGASWRWYAGGCGGTYVGTGSSISVSPGSTTTYYVRAEGNCNTTACKSVTVTVNTPSTAPSSASASPNPVCGGGSTVLSVSGGSLGTGASWKWYSGSCGGTYVGSGSSISVSPSTTTAYFVRAEGSCNTTACASVTVVAGALSTAPTSITATPNPTCGGSTTLTRNGGSLGIGASWKWYSGSCGGNFIGTGNSITVSPSSTTTYYVLAQGTCNTTGCASVSVTVNSPPTIWASPSTQSICSGGTTNIVFGSSMGGTSYSWTVAQSGVSGASNSSGGAITQTLSTTGNTTGTAVYTVTPTASGCTGSPITVTVVVNPVPNATANPSTQNICSGGVTSIGLSSNVSTTSFNWTVAQNGVSGAASGSGSNISQTLVTTGTTPGTVVYTITPSTVNCTGNPITAIVTVNPLPVATATPAIQTICSGDATSIALSSNIPGTTFSWTANQVGTSGASSGNGSTIAQTVSTTGTIQGTVNYTITPSVGGCPGTPIPVTITVNPKPVVTANPSSQAICSGNATSITLSSSLSGTSFNWTVAPTGVSGASAGNGTSIVQTLTATGSSPGTAIYTVTPTVNSTGCVGTPLPITVTVNPIPVANAVPPSQTICSGSSTGISLTSNVVGTSFAWTISQSSVTGGSGGSGTSIAQTLATTGSTPGVAVYTITPSANGCTGSPVVVNVQVDRVPVATAAPSTQTICSGDATSIALSSDIPGSTFAWTVNQSGVTGATAGNGNSITQTLATTGPTAGTATYTVIPTFGNCPGQPITVTITVNPKPDVIATPPAQSICSGSATNIALSSSVSGTTFSWIVNQTGVSGASAGSGNSIAQTLTLTGSVAGSVVYTVTPSSSNGCVGQPSSIVVTVNKQDNPTFNYSASTYCQTEPNPTPAITGLAGGTFTAVPAGLVFVNANSGQINLLASTVGSYDITYTTNGPCPATMMTNVTIVTMPDAAFSYVPTPICQHATDIAPTFPLGASAGVFTATPSGLVFVNPATGVIDLALSTPGTYQVKNTIVPGPCPGDIDSATIVINPAPVVTATPASQSLCSGSSTNIALTSSISGSTFAWTVVETGVTGASNGNGTSIAQTLTTTGNVSGTAIYTITATDPVGCNSQTLSVTITVHPIPNITATPTTQTICSGSTANVTLTSNVTGVLFNWTVVQNGVSGAADGSGLSLSQAITTTNPVAGTAIYTITPSANGCSGSPVIDTVHVNPVPVATATPAVPTICSGDTTAINLTSDVSGSTFVWTYTQTNVSGAADGNGAFIQQTLTATSNVPGIVVYSVTPTANGCSGNPIVATVTVNPRPVVTITPSPESLCSFGTTTTALTSNVFGTTYSWTVVQSGVTGAADGNGANIYQTLSTIGNVPGTAIYTVTPTASGCTGTAVNDTVTVYPIPVATATPVSQTFCSGGVTAIALTSTVSGTNFNWTVVPSNVSGANPGSGTSITDTINATAIVDGTAAYTVTPIGGGSCAGSPVSVTITVKPRPVVTPVPSPLSVCSGDTAQISLVSNIPSTTFVWGALQTAVTGAFASSGNTISQALLATTNSPGTVLYTVTPTFNGCPGSVDTINVTVNPIPVVTAVPSPVTICSRDTTYIALSSTVSGTTYSWTAIQTDVSGAVAGAGDSITMVLNNTQLAGQPGHVVYTVTPSANGCAGTPVNVNVTVLARDNAAYAYSSGTYCQTAPDTTPIIYGMQGGVFSSTPAGLSLNPVTGKISPTLSQVGSYTLSYTTNGPCPKTNSMTMTITLAPSAVFSYANPSYCQHATNPLPVFGNGASGGIFTAAPSGLAFVHVNTGEIDLSLSQPGTYTVTNTIPPSGTCAQEQSTYIVTIDSAPTVTASSLTQTMCSGGTTAFSLSSTMPGTTYNWTVAQYDVSGGSDGFNDTAISQVLATTGPITGTAVYTITPLAGGCSGLPINITVTVNPIPSATAVPSAQIVCSGISPIIALSSTVSGTNFTWTPLQTNVTGANSGSGVVISEPLTATTINSGTVVYTITPAAAGCTGTPVSVTVTVDPTPTVVATPASQTICSGDSTSIALSGTVAGTTYSWTAAQSGVSGATAGNGDTIVQILTNTFGSTPGTATYSITPSANSCPGQPVTAVVTVNPQPVVTISPSSQTICSGDATSIALTSNISGTTYSWTVVQNGVSGATANSGSSIVQTLTATDTVPGTVVYTITPSAGGCVGQSKTITVTVNPRPVVTATPNAQTICSGNSTSIALSSNVPGTQFSWTVSQNNVTGATPGSGTSIAQTLSATTNGTAVYVVNPSAGGCLGTPIPVTISVKPALVATAIPANKTICSGDSVAIFLSSNIPGTTYTWTQTSIGVSGASAGSGDTITNTLTATGNTVGTVVYTVSPAAGACTGAPIVVSITVNPLPDITATPPAQSFCSGTTSSIALSSTVLGTTYSWTVVETDVTGATAGAGPTIVQTLTTTGSSPGTAVYTITPSANGCLGTPINVTATVNVLDDASFFYSSATFCQDGTDPTPTITGLPGGTFVSTTPPFSLAVDSATGTIDLSASALGIYTLAYTTHGTCPNTSSINVTITNTSPSASFSYLGSPFCQYGTNPTPIYGGGASPGFYTASPAGLEFAHVNTGEIDLSESLPGTYTITNTIPPSGSCLGATATYVITINEAPVVTATPPLMAICAGSPTAIVLTSSMPSTTYAWTVLTTNVSGASAGAGDTIAQVLYTTGLTQGSVVYTVIPTSGSCPGQPLNVTVTVDPCPIGTAVPSTQAICSGSTTSIALTSNIVGTVFAWTATATGVTGASAGTGDGIVQTLTTTGDSVGTVTYLVSLSANGCDGVAIPVTITVNPIPTVTPTPLAQTVCSGDTAMIVLTSTVAGTQFSWTTSQLGITGGADGNGDTIANRLVASGNVPGMATYTIVPLGPGGCEGTPVVATVTVNPPPIITATPSTQVICSGQTTSVVLHSNVGSHFAWTVAQTNVSGATPDTAAVISQTLTATDSIQGLAVYSVWAIDTITGCAGTPVNVNVQVNPLPVIKATPASQIICTGSTTAVALSSNVLGTSFTWTVVQSHVSGAVPGSGSAIAQTITLTDSTHGTVEYIVTPVGGSCLGDTIHVLINVTATDSAQVAYASPNYCQTGVDPAAIIYGLPGGVFFGDSGLVLIDTLTGLIDLSASTIGLHSVYYATSGSCADTGMTYVTITPAPIPDFTYPDTAYCQGGINPVPVFGMGAISGTFSATPSGLVFVDIHTGEIDLDSSALGTYVITNTLGTNGGCGADSSSTTISIVPLTAMATPASPSVCSGSTTSISFTSSLPATAYSWTVVQTGVTGASPGTDSAGINQTLTLLGSTPGTVVYTVTPSTIGCMGDTFSVVVTVVPPPVATVINPTQTICSGTAAVINFAANQPGTVYSWIVNQAGVTGASSGLDTIISQILTTTGSDTGSVIYTIIPSFGSCSGGILTAVVDVLPADDASFVYTSATYCQSGTDPTASITGVPGGVFSASPAGLAIDSLTGTIHLSTSTVGAYTVTYTTNNGTCSNSSSITMTIGNTNPSAVFSYSSTTFCQNGTNPAPIYPSGASAGIYSVSPSGLAFVHVNTGEIDLAASAPGTYTITNHIPQSGTCLSATATTVITITGADDASFVYTSATYCTFGTNPVPSVTGLAGGIFTAMPSGLVVDSITGTINLSTSLLGVYTMSYTTNGACPATSSILMTITDSTPSTVFSYPAASYCQNGNNPVPVYDSTGSSAGIYSATPQGLAFVHVNTGEIDLAASTPGTYTVTNHIPASGSCLASTSVTTITIGGADDASFIYTSATHCQSGANPTPIITGLGGGIFSASPTGLNINASTGTIILPSSQLGVYTVTYTTNGSCQNSSSITMTITDTTPIADFSYPASPFCPSGNDPLPTFATGASAGIFSATPTGLVFVNLNTGEIDLSLSNPGTYTITNSIPASGNCLAATATSTVTITSLADASFQYSSATYCTSGTTNPTPIITGVPGGAFSAVPAGLSINATTGAINLAASTLGAYTLTYSLGGVCPNSSSIIMTITDTTPTATYTYSNTVFCQSGTNPYVVYNSGGSAGIFSATPIGLVFEHVNTGEIDIAASTPGTYLITNTIPASGNCLMATANTIITINGAPSITGTPVSQTICTGSTASVALSSSMTGTNYTWVANATGVTGASAGNGTTISQTLTVPGLNQGNVAYIVTPSVNGCVGDTVIVIVTVNPLPTIGTLLMTITSANCNDSAGSILGLAVPQGLNLTTMVWINSTGDTVSTVNVELTAAAPGSYTLHVSDQYGCANTAGPFVVGSTSNVQSAFTADPLTGDSPLSVNFTNQSTNAVNYIWYFGNDDSSTVIDPTYLITSTGGNYQVCLVAFNSFSCTDTSCVTVEITETSSFIVPNVFTPNGDGVNDVFIIKGVALETLEAEIYNRWGEKIFEWHGANGGWDGRMATGAMASDGTYYFIVKAKGKDDIEYFEKGSFTLIRDKK